MNVCHIDLKQAIWKRITGLVQHYIFVRILREGIEKADCKIHYNFVVERHQIFCKKTAKKSFKQFWYELECHSIITMAVGINIIKISFFVAIDDTSKI